MNTDIQTCIDDAKKLLEDVSKDANDYRLKNCFTQLQKLEALLKGDFEAVWRHEVEQRTREKAFHERFVKNLNTIHRERVLELSTPPAPLPPTACAGNTVVGDTPLAAALRALCAVRPPSYPPLPVLNPEDEDEGDDLYE